jgi:hypothetical protein
MSDRCYNAKWAIFQERIQKYGFATRFIRPWCMHKYQYWDLNELSMLIPCIKIQPFVSKKKKCVCGEINSFTPPFFKVEKKRAHDSHCPRCYAPVLRSGHYHLIEIGFFFHAMIWIAIWHIRLYEVYNYSVASSKRTIHLYL